MPLTGNLAELRSLASRVDGLSEVPSRAAKRAIPELDASLQAEFSAGTDPYGAPWVSLSAATLRRGRSAPPLTDTGRMRATAKARAASRSGLAVTIAPPAQFLERKRPMLPEHGEPPRWREIIEGAVEAEVKAVMR